MPFDNGKKFIGLSSFEMLAMFRRGLFYAYLTIYLRHYLGLSVTATTLFATLPMLVNVMSQTFIWGSISDRFQLRRSLIMAGEILGAMGTLLVWYGHRVPESRTHAGYIIILGLTIVEIFWSMSNISWSALISDLYPQKDRAAVQGRLASMGGFGRIAGVWVGGVLYDGPHKDSAGWGFYHGDLFFVAAGVMLISTLPLFLLPEGGTSTAPGIADQPVLPVADETRRTFRRFVVFIVGIALINFGRNSVAIVLPQYLTLASGLSLDSLTLSHILNTQSAAIVFFGWMVGWVCRRLGSHITLLVAGASAFSALILIAACTTLPLIYLSSFLRGVADATILAAAYAVASVLIPAQKRARHFAWFNAAFFLSWGVPGTLIIGPLIDLLIAAGYHEVCAYQISFVVAAGIVLSGLAVQFTLYRTLPAAKHPVL